MTPEAVRHNLRELGGHNLGGVTSTTVEELLLYPGACDTRHQLTVLQALLRVHALLLTEGTLRCPVCHELLPAVDDDGNRVGHTQDCPLDIGGP